jgi:hypothetical protein
MNKKHIYMKPILAVRELWLKGIIAESNVPSHDEYSEQPQKSKGDFFDDIPSVESFESGCD